MIDSSLAEHPPEPHVFFDQALSKVACDKIIHAGPEHEAATLPRGRIKSITYVASQLGLTVAETS